MTQIQLALSSSTDHDSRIAIHVGRLVSAHSRIPVSLSARSEIVMNDLYRHILKSNLIRGGARGYNNFIMSIRNRFLVGVVAMEKYLYL